MAIINNDRQAPRRDRFAVLVWIVFLMLIAFASFMLWRAIYVQPRRVQALILEMGNPDPQVRGKAAGLLATEDTYAARTTLWAAFSRGDEAVIDGAYEFYIREGRSGSEGVLIKALGKSDNASMAEAYANSGNSKLYDAAYAWAARHGYSIKGEPATGFSYSEWGSQ